MVLAFFAVKKEQPVTQTRGSFIAVQEEHPET
jgi:hypothetical protein